MCGASSLLALASCCLLLSPLVEAAPASVPGEQAAVDSSLTIFRYSVADDIPKDQQDAAYSEYVAAIRQALARSAFTEAQQMAQRAILLWPDRQRPYLHLAQAEIGAQRWSPCIVAARQARDAESDTLEPPALPEESLAASDYWEGLGFHQTQRYEEALPFLASAAATAAHWPEAQRAYGECAFILGDIENAAQAYERAYSLDGDIGGVRDLSYYADSMARRGDLEAAIAAMESAVQRFPYEAGLHAKLATFYQQEGNLLDAYYHFTLEMLVQGVRGEYSAKARAATNELYEQVEADTTSPYRHELVLVSQGMTDMESGRPHEALHALEHVKRVTRSTTIVPYLILADAQLHVNQLAEARQTLDQALSLHPSFVPAMVMMARTLRMLDEKEAAQEMIEKAFELFPTYWKLRPENTRQRG